MENHAYQCVIFCFAFLRVCNCCGNINRILTEWYNWTLIWQSVVAFCFISRIGLQFYSTTFTPVGDVCERL